MYAFETRQLRKEYRLEGHVIPVLQGVDVEIPSGRWTALIGPSGCGKTTLLHLLGALDRPTAGEIRCCGVAYHRLSAGARSQLRRRTLGLVFQAYYLFPELSAEENVVLPALYWGSDKAVVRARARDLLESFGLGDRLRHRPQELSGGEQQRVALARALINDPTIILADEPTGNLDAESGRGIMEILARLNREQGRTVVMVTHDLGLARQADGILQMRDGKVVPVVPAPAQAPVAAPPPEAGVTAPAVAPPPLP